MDKPALIKRNAERRVEGWRTAEITLDDFDALIAENESAHKHWQNESNNVQVLVAEVARLKAENEALRREREGKVICDLELFETLRDSANTEADEHRRCMATYRPLRQASLDSVVKKCDDLLAAMGKGEQSEGGLQTDHKSSESIDPEGSKGGLQ